METIKPCKYRGFASLSPEKRKEIARKGGLAVAAKGTAHRWNAEEAKVFARIGGLKSRGGGRPRKTG
jgi:general stress protein YciG